MATAVWLVAVVAAALLAAGTLVVALGLDPGNAGVSFAIDVADRLNLLGDLITSDGGRTAPARQDALVRTVLVSWSIAAVVYLVVGKVAERLIRP